MEKMKAGEGLLMRVVESCAWDIGTEGVKDGETVWCENGNHAITIYGTDES